jgi:thymidylate synthase (FAD)
MNLILPAVEIMQLPPRDFVLELIEAAGRTAYKSEGKACPGSASKFVHSIAQVKKHESVIEHAMATVRFTVDRGVSHELVRHRLSSFTQESTRYVDYSGDKTDGHCQFIIPNWLPDLEPGLVDNSAARRSYSEAANIWLSAMLDAERSYAFMRKNLQWTPQQARCVLPNSTKTEVVMSCNMREWAHVFRTRTAPNAHPQMREVMIPLCSALKAHLPELYSGIEVEADYKSRVQVTWAPRAKP